MKRERLCRPQKEAAVELGMTEIQNEPCLFALSCEACKIRCLISTAVICWRIVPAPLFERKWRTNEAGDATRLGMKWITMRGTFGQENNLTPLGETFLPSHCFYSLGSSQWDTSRRRPPEALCPNGRRLNEMAGRYLETIGVGRHPSPSGIRWPSRKKWRPRLLSWSGRQCELTRMPTAM